MSGQEPWAGPKILEDSAWLFGGLQISGLHKELTVCSKLQVRTLANQLSEGPYWLLCFVAFHFCLSTENIMDITK